MTYIVLAVLLFLLSIRTHFQARDINRLYSSRDSLWKELHAEGQARKRQNTNLRRQNHALREKMKGLVDQNQHAVLRSVVTDFINKKK